MYETSVFVSVVIPLYNKEKYIKSTIESILKQNDNNFEIIIVNDGSTDKSLSIVESFKDSRIRIISQTNGGVSKARNTGIKNCSGDWIAFLDADDLWGDNFLYTFKNMLNKYNNAALIGLNYGYLDSKNNNLSMSMYREGPLNDVYFDYCLYRYPFNSSSVIIKKNCFEELGGFRVDLKEGEDLEMWYRIIKQGKPSYYCPIICSYYRKDESNQKNRQRKISLTNIWGYHLNFDNVTNESEILYLNKRIISLCKIIILNNNSINNLIKIFQRYGTKRILSGLYKSIKFKYKK